MKMATSNNKEICLPSFIALENNPICSKCRMNNSDKWCPTCEEMMCNDCAKKDKNEKQHDNVPLVQNLNFTSICSKHKHEKIETFCADCEQIVCNHATTAFHKDCGNKCTISTVTEGVDKKIYNDVNQLECRLTDLKTEIEKILKRQEMSSHLVESSMESEKKCISKRKNDILCHFDRLEKNLHEQIEEKMKFIRHQLTISKSDYDSFSVWIEDIKKLKNETQSSSLFQIKVFIENKMDEFQRRSLNADESVQCLKYQPANEVLNIETIIPSLGTIRYNDKEPEMELLTSIQLQDFKLKINMCCFLPLHRILTYNSADSLVQVFHFDGSLLKQISVTHPVIQVCIFNKQLLMCGSPTGLSKIDLNTGNCKEIIKLEKPCRKFACLDKKIYFMRDKTICVMDALGSIKKEIKPNFELTDFVISKSGQVYYTAFENDDIFEIPLNEEQRSIYRHSQLKKVNGMVLDENDNLYVVGEKSNNIHKIFADRQNATIILNESHGISSPLGISYNEESKEMMILNDAGSSIHLYKIS